MVRRGLASLAVLVAAVSPAWAQWESGSDGTDGAFSPAVTTVVDLSLAASLCDCDGGGTLNDPCRWDCPSPVAGRGVYDAQQWAVVFKYTTVDVPAGVTVTFGMHPSGAPVVWLATGNVNISGLVNVDGEDGFAGTNPPIIPYYARPGPGGFQGGQAGHAGQVGYGFGFGPGSSPTQQASTAGGAASHATVAPTCHGPSTGATYGTAALTSLIGGSGGNSEPGVAISRSSGGAGGGAILIGSTTQVTVGTSGAVTAEGGDKGSVGFEVGGPGSGGAIRLRAETVTLSSGSQILARGGQHFNCGDARGAPGRIRIEANTITNSGTIAGSQSFPGAPSPVFSASAPPQLYVTSVCGQAAPLDPMWGINSADIDLNAPSACTVNIEATGVPVGTIVVVRAIPARGSIISANSTPLADAGGGLRTGTASVTFPGGRTELQLRANW